MAGDVDGDGAIDYEEFIALMCPAASDIVEKFRAKYKNVNDVKAAFKRFDRNGDGALEKDELADALKSSGESFSSIEVDAIFSLWVSTIMLGAGQQGGHSVALIML